MDSTKIVYEYYDEIPYWKDQSSIVLLKQARIVFRYGSHLYDFYWKRVSDSVPTLCNMDLHLWDEANTRWTAVLIKIPCVDIRTRHIEPNPLDELIKDALQLATQIIDGV